MNNRTHKGDPPWPATAPGIGGELSPEHRKALEASAISEDVIKARGYFTCNSKAELSRLHGSDESVKFTPTQQRVPTLVIPVLDVHGQVCFYQHRPDEPRHKDSKPIKYETPTGAAMHMDIHPCNREKLGNPTIPLFITEGIKKADSATSRGLCCVALLGVYGWRGTNEQGGKVALPDFESIALNGREVTICFDSDVMLKAGPAMAMARLAAFLQGRGAYVFYIYLPHGTGGTKQGMDDFFAAGGTVDDLLSHRTTELRESDGEQEKNKPQAARLVELSGEVELFHTEQMKGYVSAPVNGHREIFPIRSETFRQWLRRQFYEAEGGIPGGQAMQDALGVLEAKAQFDGPTTPVYIRIAGVENRVYLDLCNDKWEQVEITADGWQVIGDSPVKFRRAPGMLPLPYPTRGGSLNDLRPFVNTGDDGDGKSRFILLTGWLIGAMNPEGPYAVLSVLGERGSTKTTACRVLRSLIDPNKAPARSKPRDEGDLAIAANNGWTVSLDNLSGLPLWLSDALCQLATGGGFSKRELYTDEGEIVFNHTRPIILNGIEEPATQSDLMDRQVLVHLPVLAKDRPRKPEKQFWREFESARPALLGALLEAVSAALRCREKVKLSNLPRMADFAEWVAASEMGLGHTTTGANGETDSPFVAAYENNRASVNDLALEASGVARLVIELVERAPGGRLTVTASELLAALNAEVDDEVKRQREWPKAPNKLAGVLRRLAPNLRAGGINVTEPTCNRSKIWVLERVGDLSSQPSQPSPQAQKDPESEDDEDDTPASEDDRGTIPEDPFPVQKDDRDDGDDTLPFFSNEPSEVVQNEWMVTV